MLDNGFITTEHLKYMVTSVILDMDRAYVDPVVSSDHIIVHNV